MKKILKNIFVIAILFMALTPVFYAHASQANPAEACRFDDGGNPSDSRTAVNFPCGQTGYYQLLAPLPTVSATFNPADENALGTYLNLMIKAIIGIAAVLAVVMIVIGGIEYMTSELISGKEAGKERMTQAIFGLLLALGAYAILYTINPNLLSTAINIKDVTIQVDINADVPQTPDPTTKKYPNGALAGAPWDDSVAKLTDLPAGVSIYNSQCTNIGQTSCTSTRGLSLDYINAIQKNCSGCGNLTITGGTESWLHGGATGNTSHMVGSPTVDLNPTPELTQYIANGKPLVYYQRYSNGIDGISYLWENNHWHVGP